MSVLLVGRLGLEVDTMASEWSMGRALPWVAFRVEEELHGEAAEKHCIDEMVRYSTDLLLFWDGVSTDFDYLLERAKKRKLKVKVFVCEPAEETDDFEELVSRLEKHWTSEVEDGQSRESD